MNRKIDRKGDRQIDSLIQTKMYANHDKVESIKIFEQSFGDSTDFVMSYYKVWQMACNLLQVDFTDFKGAYWMSSNIAIAILSFSLLFPI